MAQSEEVKLVRMGFNETAFLSLSLLFLFEGHVAEPRDFVLQLAGVRESLQEQIDSRCQELSEGCRAKAIEQAGQLADQAKQMEPALLKLTQQVTSMISSS